jgi:hypothetical protein
MNIVWDDEANSEDEQDFISNASIFFLVIPQLFCAQKVRNPRFTIHRTYVSPLRALVNQSKVLLILMVQATNLASIIDWFPDSSLRLATEPIQSPTHKSTTASL